MFRKLSFRRDRNRKSQAGVRRKHNRKSPLRNSMLGVEQLELRALLAADPLLSIPAGQFFATDNDVIVPFRASFGDIFESVPEVFSYSIDWGDVSADSTGATGDLSGTIEHMHANPTAPIPLVNDPLIGRIKTEHPFDVAGEYTVTVTLSDSQLDSGPAIVPTTVQVYDVDFGLDVALDVTSPINEGDTAFVTLTDDPSISEWTINWGDGTIETIAGNPGAASHVYADDLDFNSGDTEFSIFAAAKVLGTYKFAGSNTSVTVEDVEMATEISADPSVNQGENLDIELNAADPGDEVFQWIIDWGDSSGETAVGNPCNTSHVYNTPGPYFITVFAINDDGLQAEPILHAITVTGQTQGTSLVDGTLFINGSTTGTGNDTASITLSGGNISVNASVNGTNPFVAPISSVNAIVIDLGSGSDILVTAANINIPMTINGGEGNDLITAGGGDDLIEGGPGVDIVFGAGGADVLLGGSGTDSLFGGSGNDVLIGGDGSDILSGDAGRDLLIGSDDEDLLSSGDGDDILIGGSTDWDGYNDLNSKANIDNIMAIWTGAGSFTARVNALLASTSLQPDVFTDDNATDLILGSGGRDLIFGDDVLDIILLNGLDTLIEVT